MTIQEMHIDFNIQVQRLNSNSLRTYESEEIDMNLNWAIRHFIKNRTNVIVNPQRRGFEVDEKRLQDMQELVVPVNLECFRDTFDTERMYAYLPDNHFLTVGKRGLVWYDCKNPVIDKLISDVSNYKVIKFNITTVVDWTNFIIEEAPAFTNTIFDINNYTDYIDVTDVDLFEFLEVLRKRMKEQKITVYWENYGVEHEKNTLFFIYPSSAGITGLRFTTGVAPVITTITPTDTPYSIWSQTDNVPTNDKPEIEVVRNDEIDNLRKSPFGKTKWSYPIATVSDNLFYVYVNDDFYIERLLLTYIRKPMIVNYKLNHHCDLNENFHDEIVNVAARRVASIVTAENTEGIIQNEISNQ